PTLGAQMGHDGEHQHEERRGPAVETCALALVREERLDEAVKGGRALGSPEQIENEGVPAGEPQELFRARTKELGLTLAVLEQRPKEHLRGAKRICGNGDPMWILLRRQLFRDFGQEIRDEHPVRLYRF